MLYHLNKGMTFHWEGRFIPYDDTPNKFELEWSRKQKNCTKMAGAHPRLQFLIDERVFMVLKYTETVMF